MQSIKKALYVIPRPISKTYVMQKVFGDLVIVDFVLKSINSQNSRLVVAQREIINGLMSTLGDVNNPCTYAKLVIKHALLTNAINSIESNIYFRHKACVLGVHHCNVSFVVNINKGLIELVISSGPTMVSWWTNRGLKFMWISNGFLVD